MALTSHHPANESPHTQTLRGIAPWFVYYALPILIGLLIAAAAILLPPRYQDLGGQPLTTRFLVGPAAVDAEHALQALNDAPTRLSAYAPVGRAWLLADLPQTEDPFHEPRRALLLPTHNIEAPECWLLGGLQANGQRAETLNAMTPRLEPHVSALGYRMRLPATAMADRALCQVDVRIPGHLGMEQWTRDALFGDAVQTAQASGLLEGGLVTLAIFLTVIGFTMREPLYVLLSCWLIAVLRLGGWALGWDYQIFGHVLSPDILNWARRLALLLFYVLTYTLFSSMFHLSLDERTQTQITRIGHLSAVALALALVIVPYPMLHMVIFLATWLGTALAAVILVHALLHYNTRSQLLHAIGVAGSLAILLTGIILVGLHQSSLIAILPGTTCLLMVGLLVALAGADQMREARQVRIRQRNDLIAHDSLTPLGLFTLGTTRHFEHMSPNTRSILNIPESIDFHTLTWEDFFDETDWPAVSKATEEGRDTEILQRKEGVELGHPRSFLLRATLVGSRIEGSLQDVSARTETIRKLRLMADNDPLTDTLNRRGIETEMQQSIDALCQDGTPCALGFLDLDHLKHINNLFGHTAGDTLLQMVCERLKYSLSNQQKLGRIGNDEFIILFPGLRASEAQRVGQDMIESLNTSAIVVGERSFQLKSAMGIIDIDRSMGPKDAIAAASRACRDARKQHRDLVLYEENAHELFDHIDELHLLEQLHKGEVPNDIHLEMQPIMSLRHPLQTMNFEALLRVKSQQRVLTTERMIEAAEDNGMITAIDKWVFTTMLEWLSKHRLKLAKVQCVNLNLSGVSLNDDHFIDTLIGILNQQPQFTRRLCVEITEGVALQDLERTRQFMRRLQRMGTRVALDDFGAGYTSFSYLKELPADSIKIDGTLIRDMMASQANIAIVGSIVELAHNLGMECIAEWVEDLATLRTLTNMGVDHVQGYVISAARSPTDMLAHDNVLPLVEDPAVRRYIEELSGRA